MMSRMNELDEENRQLKNNACRGTTDSRNHRFSNVIDDINREELGIAVDFSLLSERVIRSPDRIIEWGGKPISIRCDNAP